MFLRAVDGMAISPSPVDMAGTSTPANNVDDEYKGINDELYRFNNRGPHNDPVESCGHFALPPYGSAHSAFSSFDGGIDLTRLAKERVLMIHFIRG